MLWSSGPALHRKLNFVLEMKTDETEGPLQQQQQQLISNMNERESSSTMGPAATEPTLLELDWRNFKLKFIFRSCRVDKGPARNCKWQKRWAWKNVPKIRSALTGILIQVVFMKGQLSIDKKSNNSSFGDTRNQHMYYALDGERSPALKIKL